ncbi:MAG: DUF3524 domain-containing protein [Flavobacteriales bacterium]|nr:DUF3524 domain-containing protein [Flavobacteriales bacterium]
MSKKVLLIEAFYVGSHKKWVDSVKQLFINKGHDVKLLTLPGRHWKWRMYGAAEQLSKSLDQLQFVPDVVIATDMLDLAAFLGMTRKWTAKSKIISYFHENQLTYPWSKDDGDIELKRDRSYAYINYRTALVSDEVYFNSEYHLNSFINALPSFLKAFPDGVDQSSIFSIKERSSVLYLGLDLKDLISANREVSEIPTILWNHRWEYDKNPSDFLKMLRKLKSNDLRFNLIICGENTSKYPKEFDTIKFEFKEELVHFGYAASRYDYEGLLLRSDVLPVTNNQDFFGGSIVEAIAAGCIPILPNRLSYNEHIPVELVGHFIFGDQENWFVQVENSLKKKDNYQDKLEIIRNYVLKYDWRNLESSYLSLLN